MQNKILNLKLKYKNLYLDTAKYGRDFHDNFYIGSDKMMLWQILDNSFPEKFKLVSRVKDDFQLNLWDEMDVLVKKDDKIYSKQQLVENGLIENGAIILEQNQMGRIKFLKNWEIEYNFAEPFELVLSEEEKQTIKKFATFTPLSPQEKFTRLFLTLGTIFTIVGLMIFENNYTPLPVNDLASRLTNIEEMATRVEIPDIVEEQSAPHYREGTETEVKAQVQQAQHMSAKQFQAEFGLSLSAGLNGGGGGDLKNQLLQVTEVREIVAAGSGKGSGSGTSPQITRGTSELDVISSKVQLGEGEGLGDIGGLDGVDLANNSGFESVDLANLGGSVGNYTITKIESKKKFEEIKKRFSGIRMMTEGNIGITEMKPQEKTQLAYIDQIVATYKPQIIKLFTTQSMMIDMYGTLQFSLIIGAGGKIEAVDINEISGSYFTPTFIEKCREIMMNWKIDVTEPVVYSFRMKFYK